MAMTGQCCGIDEAIRYIKDIREIYEVGIEQNEKGELVINRLEYHRNQAEGQKPKYHKGDCVKDWYTCRNCGVRVEITFNFCPGCGYRIRWDSTRCLTGLPLVDAAERAKDEADKESV